MIAQEDLVLDVPASLVAVVAARRDRDVERVVPVVPAKAQHVAGADRAHVGRFDVECLGVEIEGQRLAVGAAREQVRGLPVEQVREERDSPAALCVPGGEVAHARAIFDVERSDAGMDDAPRSGDSAGERHPAAVGHVVVRPAVEFRLLRARVREGRVLRVEGVVHEACGPRQRILREISG